MSGGVHSVSIILIFVSVNQKVRGSECGNNEISYAARCYRSYQRDLFAFCFYLFTHHVTNTVAERNT